MGCHLKSYRMAFCTFHALCELLGSCPGFSEAKYLPNECVISAGELRIVVPSFKIIRRVGALLRSRLIRFHTILDGVSVLRELTKLALLARCAVRSVRLYVAVACL